MFNKQQYIKEVIQKIDNRDMKRILNTDKKFILFRISVFNTGFVVQVTCTDDLNRCNREVRNGYSFYLCNIPEEIELEIPVNVQLIIEFYSA